MRLLLGFVALLAALAGVGMLVKTQLKAIGSAPAPAAVAGSSPASGPALVRDTQRRIADDIGAALEQGEARRREGDAAGEGGGR